VVGEMGGNVGAGPPRQVGHHSPIAMRESNGVAQQTLGCRGEFKSPLIERLIQV